MKALGYPLTYPTTCFIDGGCGEKVYAHTNGYEDFVLFDTLGSPWPIHDCYLNRFCPSGDVSRPRTVGKVYTDQEWALELARQHRDYKDAGRKASEDRSRRPTREIVKVNPESLHNATLHVVGYVQDMVERKAAKVFGGAGSLAQQVTRKALGNRESQVTIVDADFRSYTAFIDLREMVLSKRMTVVAGLKSQDILGIGAVFVCEGLEILPVMPGAQV